ncbi:hypothetical protein [Legionella spiritensis]|uniref:hypothetical protein n=1 Tax=Legionella spiritensis TaxID=452 RepID=UPI000F6CE4CA|nr:hypothetical protein [Legionella spiritensis]VEG91293.1 Uncharacterised protein [Legionella spiritensis]
MKWIALIPVIFLLSACCCTRNTEVVEYRQVTVAPPYQSITILDEEPVDVTTTTVEYY